MSTLRLRPSAPTRSPLELPIRFLPPRPSKPSFTHLGRPRPSRRAPPPPPALAFQLWLRSLPWRFFFIAFAISAVTSFALERYYAHEVRLHACGAR